jgi:ABC-type dipeptide/oligopeptide/nickel transport system ATPase component|tara:strand:- start:678 stop:956 length:279 start_codon:yes stop_codon:yes gene_type:complete
MRCIAYSSNDSYKHKLIKTSQNVLNDVYKKKAIEQQPKQAENLRLRLRFKEAIQEAQEICEDEGKKSKECHLAWYEVDELDDAMSRYYPNRD